MSQSGSTTTVQKNSTQKYSVNLDNKGVFFYENLRPNQQLDVLGYKGFLQNLSEIFIFRGVFLLFAKQDEEFYSF